MTTRNNKRKKYKKKKGRPRREFEKRKGRTRRRLKKRTHKKRRVYGPKYAPWLWNDNIFIKNSHNCYTYALNKQYRKFADKCRHTLRNNKGKPKDQKKRCIKPQPGVYAGCKKINKPDYTCDGVERRMMLDNEYMIKLQREEEPPKKYYKIAMTCKGNGKDYHFYRRNEDGTWSHKTGMDPVSDLDFSGKKILDPINADRGEYNIFCGYYAIPYDRNYKHARIDYRLENAINNGREC
jgi:hypothetical protein